ncbi:MAG: hypothetical protein V1857_04030 [archaeon]
MRRSVVACEWDIAKDVGSTVRKKKTADNAPRTWHNRLVYNVLPDV